MNRVHETDTEGLRWQRSVWDRMSTVYGSEVDPRFAPVVRGVTTRAALASGDRVLDLGTGTGAVAWAASPLVGPRGSVTAVDISPEMLAMARAEAARRGLGNVYLREGSAEAVPVEDASFDVAIASLSLMYSVDRPAAARELARVLRPGGRLVAAVWAGPERCDIVRFQQIAGSFAPKPPVPGVGPGALADPDPFLAELRKAGFAASVETEELGFEFPSFAIAWAVLAGVTTSGLSSAQREKAKEGVREAMWPDAHAPRAFRNLTQFIVGTRR